MNVLLASPRGFCAGVERAIDIVEVAIALYGTPVYVRKEIVHNTHVVRDFQTRGVIFVDSLDEVPSGAVVVFSAHGVSPSVWEAARARGLDIIDATCPLVTKVHLEVRRFAADGYSIVLIGHEGHDEVIGTMGEAPGQVILVGSEDEVERIDPPDVAKLVYLTQTTLSVDETRGIIAALKRKFPAITAPPKDDICYATQNRQDAVRQLAENCDAILVLGSANSSNSVRLCEVAEREGARAYRIDSAAEILPEWVEGARSIGITAGASTPEVLVQETVDRLRSLGAERVQTLTGVAERVQFALPRELAERASDNPEAAAIIQRSRMPRETAADSRAV